MSLDTTHQTIRQLLAARADETPQAAALLGPGRLAWSYEQLAHQVHEVVTCLNERCIGRQDRVAVGKKIGPREVDDALLAHPAVAEAVTFAVSHRTLGQDVAAAVVLKTGEQADERAIRAEIAHHIPEYMVPSRIVILDSLPKTATGKTQRRGLEQQLSDRLHPQRIPPRDTLAKYLAQLWSSLLNVQEPGMQDNFFALGGDSLTGQQLVNRLHSTLGLALPLNWVFLRPGLADQTRYLSQEGFEQVVLGLDESKGAERPNRRVSPL